MRCTMCRRPVALMSYRAFPLTVISVPFVVRRVVHFQVACPVCTCDATCNPPSSRQLWNPADNVEVPKLSAGLGFSEWHAFPKQITC
jgi:hypothetical protein